ncbi:hypothetical protein PAXINDRAFT_103300, partial [Paxillus involutus ATCC 200175]
MARIPKLSCLFTPHAGNHVNLTTNCPDLMPGSCHRYRGLDHRCAASALQVTKLPYHVTQAGPSFLHQETPGGCADLATKAGWWILFPPQASIVDQENRPSQAVSETSPPRHRDVPGAFGKVAQRKPCRRCCLLQGLPGGRSVSTPTMSTHPTTAREQSMSDSTLENTIAMFPGLLQIADQGNPANGTLAAL